MDTRALTKVGGPAPHTRSAREIKDTVEAERGGVPFLVWRDGHGAQRIFLLEERRTITIGRRSSNDVSLDSDAEVSRVHAQVEPIGEDWAIADVGLSLNGTFVGQDRISGRRRLVDGDVLRLGRTLVEYRRPKAGSTVITSPASAGAYGGALSDMQRAILIALARPYKAGSGFATPAGNAAIAGEVHLSLDAVKRHLTVLFRRFEINHLPQNRKRARLVECAFQWGLVTERDL